MNSMEDLQKYPHKRLNILTNEWVLVSPHRTQRPWQGSQESIQKSKKSTYDPNCYLCPGNTRANGEKNPEYQNVFAFDNDFAALYLNDKKNHFTRRVDKCRNRRRNL